MEVCVIDYNGIGGILHYNLLAREIGKGSRRGERFRYSLGTVPDYLWLMIVKIENGFYLSVWCDHYSLVTMRMLPLDYNKAPAAPGTLKELSVLTPPKLDPATAMTWVYRRFLMRVMGSEVLYTTKVDEWIKIFDMFIDRGTVDPKHSFYSDYHGVLIHWETYRLPNSKVLQVKSRFGDAEFNGIKGFYERLNKFKDTHIRIEETLWEDKALNIL